MKIQLKKGNSVMLKALASILIFTLATVILMVPASFLMAGQDTPADSSLMVKNLQQKAAGDLDAMAKRRVIRVLTVFNPMFYYLDKGDQKGIIYEVTRAFETLVNKKLKTKTLKLHVVLLPVERDQLLPGLVEGRGDLAIANLTITPERQKVVDFCNPFLTDVKELAVTGPKGPQLKHLDDLSGQTVYARASSSYYTSLQRLNAQFKKAGRKPVKIVKADELLEDHDLLEMVNAGLLPAVVVDSHKAHFWDQVFDKITVHENIAVNSGGKIAWAMRKNSPKLKAVVNEFVKTHKQGSLSGIILIKRYLKDAAYVKDALSSKDRQRFESMVKIFHKYATRYEFDFLMVAAQGYQESRLDQSKRSRAGAIGVMQLLPSTAKDPNVGIPNIEKLEPNIHAGTKYLHFLYNRYYKDEPIRQLDKWLFSFAAYNVGPARVAQLRKKAPSMGLNPNRWFGHVEVAAARTIGREPVSYVSNIYKYYVAYRTIMEQEVRKGQLKQVEK